jgi:transcription antitermination factor NusG
MPLFPSYLFVRIVRSSEVLLRVLKVPGIVDFVRKLNGPVAIPDDEIENVHTILSRDIKCSPHSFVSGDRVRVVRGSLAGVKGVLLRRGPQSKLIISVEMIHRSVAVNVDSSDVEHIAEVAARDHRPARALQSA